MNTISIIVTCHNLENFLEECINSIKTQTHLPTEIILCHDGCEKPTAFAGVHTSFRENNIGVARTRDEGARIATGDYIMFMDADDVLIENYIEEMMKTIQGADVAYPDALLYSSWGDSGMKNRMHTVSDQVTFKKLLEMNQVYICSLMRREVYDTVGGFDPELLMYEDWKFWLQAAYNPFKFKKAATFFKYRQRTQGRNRQKDELKLETYDLIKEYFIKRSTNAKA